MEHRAAITFGGREAARDSKTPGGLTFPSKYVQVGMVRELPAGSSGGRPEGLLAHNMRNLSKCAPPRHRMTHIGGSPQGIACRSLRHPDLLFLFIRVFGSGGSVFYALGNGGRLVRALTNTTFPETTPIVEEVL